MHTHLRESMSRKSNENHLLLQNKSVKQNLSRLVFSIRINFAVFISHFDENSTLSFALIIEILEINMRPTQSVNE